MDGLDKLGMIQFIMSWANKTSIHHATICIKIPQTSISYIQEFIQLIFPDLNYLKQFPYCIHLIIVHRYVDQNWLKDIHSSGGQFLATQRSCNQSILSFFLCFITIHKLNRVITKGLSCFTVSNPEKDIALPLSQENTPPAGQILLYPA